MGNEKIEFKLISKLTLKKIILKFSLLSRIEREREEISERKETNFVRTQRKKETHRDRQTIEYTKKLLRFLFASTSIRDASQTNLN